MMAKRPDPLVAQNDRQDAAQRGQDDPPIRLAHVLFVLWVAGSAAWALLAAKLAHHQEWWVLRPVLAAVLVVAHRKELVEQNARTIRRRPRS